MSEGIQTLKKTTLLHTGKAKSVYATEDEPYIILHFRDDISAYNQLKVAKLDRKGLINNYFNAFMMQYLGKMGVPTHFVARRSDTESVVRRLKMLPIEFVVRNRAAGSLCKRFGIERGKVLKRPISECFLKNDELGDPMVNTDHICVFEWATLAHVQEAQRIALRINQVLTELFDSAGLILVDFKLEFGIYKGKLLMGDEFTPDGCRVWDKETKDSLDKDLFREGRGHVVENYERLARRLSIPLSE